MAIDVTDPARAAYDALAPFYDDFVRDHDHDAWADALEALARRHGVRGRRALDLGCGTGKSLAPLLAKGYDAVGCDLSPEMLARAARALPGCPVLVEADVRRLPALGAFDLVWCLSDGLNYVRTERLADVFAGVARNLARDGVLLFDVNTLWCYRRFFAATAVVPSAHQVLVWEGRGDGRACAGDHAAATLTAYVPKPDGFWEATRTDHEQQHHAAPAITAALRRAGLDLVATYGAHLDGSLEPAVDEDTHSKAVYVARHVAPGEEGR